MTSSVPERSAKAPVIRLQGVRKSFVLPKGAVFDAVHPLSLDIPELVTSTAAMHPDVDIVMMAGFGEDPAVLGVLVAQVRRAAAR